MCSVGLLYRDANSTTFLISCSSSFPIEKTAVSLARHLRYIGIFGSVHSRRKMTAYRLDLCVVYRGKKKPTQMANHPSTLLLSHKAGLTAPPTAASDRKVLGNVVIGISQREMDKFPEEGFSHRRPGLNEHIRGDITEEEKDKIRTRLAIPLGASFELAITD